MSRRPSTIPRLLIVPAGLAVALFALPILALIARAPWGELTSILSDDDTGRAVGLSLVTSLITTGIATTRRPGYHVRPGRRPPHRPRVRAFPMHYDAHQPVINELEARILTL
ncbi:MAG: hypothetical protein ACO38A_06625, partial [Ilumatobacteraceae bacterium]